jgi:DNA polymerase III alpha subunit (gram-positive type)
MKEEEDKNMQKYELYVVDTETTGLSFTKNEPIEISIYRLSTDVQKTWMLKPINMDHISEDALRVNKHKLEDLRGLTKYGQELYRDPSKVLVDIENWLAADMVSSGDRVIVAHNAPFDVGMLKELWNKCDAGDTFPFNSKYMIDTFQLEVAHDIANNKLSEGYSLYALTKKYGIVNSQAHSAAADTLATVQLFRRQMQNFKR